MSTSGEQPRIVRRRAKRAAAAHHGGSWKIAYSDFMTAMMAFFLVMWLLTLLPKENLSGLAEYFRTPLLVAMQQGNSQANSDSLLTGGAQLSIDQSQAQRIPLPAAQNKGHAEARDMQRLENFKGRLEEFIEKSPKLRAYRPQMRIDITSEGLRIQIIDNKNRPMFATGSAIVEPYMRDILREIGPILNEVPNRISLSGHTDAHPYSSGERAYSNWELSSDRANASRRELVNGGMTEDKVMRVLGMGSSMPLVSNDVLADMNRRISLVLLTQRTQQRIESENASAANAKNIETAADMKNQLDAGEPISGVGTVAPAQDGVAPPTSDSALRDSL